MVFWLWLIESFRIFGGEQEMEEKYIGSMNEWEGEISRKKKFIVLLPSRMKKRQSTGWIISVREWRGVEWFCPRIRRKKEQYKNT